jgi:hypothetical protein
MNYQWGTSFVFAETNTYLGAMTDRVMSLLVAEKLR